MFDLRRPALIYFLTSWKRMVVGLTAELNIDPLAQLFVVAVPMMVVSDKGSETGQMIEFQKILRFVCCHRPLCTMPELNTHLTDKMRTQTYPKMNSSHGSKYRASTTRQSKGSGHGCDRGRDSTSATSSLAVLQDTTQMIHYTCKPVSF